MTLDPISERADVRVGRMPISEHGDIFYLLDAMCLMLWSAHPFIETLK